MRYIFALILTVALAGVAAAQNEQASITEKPLAFADWTLPNVKGGGEGNLRTFAKDKKLVMVVYWAPWCPNWKHDIEFVQSLHQRYAKAGLGVIGVGSYDPVEKMRAHLDQYKLTFPSVYESDSQAARLTSNHYQMRTSVGDKRKWGTPWYVFLEPAAFPAEGALLTEKTTTIVNGELIKEEAEKFIRNKLGIDEAAMAVAASSKAIEVCEPEKKVASLTRP